MSMYSIRAFSKRHRVVIMVVIVLLIASILITYAAVGKGNSSTATTEEQMKAQVASLEEYLAKTDVEGAELDYTTAVSLADAYYALAYYYGQLKDARESETYAKAVPFYEEAIALAPEGLNDLAYAKHYSSAGTAAFLSADYESANTYHKKAIELAPDNWEIARNYAYFLLSYEDAVAAIAYLTEFKANYAKDADTVTEVDNTISILKYFITTDEPSGDDTTDGDSTDGGAEAE